MPLRPRRAPLAAAAALLLLSAAPAAAQGFEPCFVNGKPGAAFGTETVTCVAATDPRVKRAEARPDQLAGLAQLPNLKRLRISLGDGTGPFDLSGLARLQGLEEVEIFRKGPVDLSPLLALPKLRALQLSVDAVDALAALDRPLGVTSLNLWGSDRNVDLRKLAAWPNLTSLTLTVHDVTGLDALAAAGRLTEFNLTLHGAADVRPLGGLKGLERLRINPYAMGGRLEAGGFAFLRGLTGLKRLDLTGAGIADLSPLSGMRGLRLLWLGRNRGVSDLSPLAPLTELVELRLSNLPVADIAPLAGMTKMRMLKLDGTKVTDISALAGMAELDAINLTGTGVSDISALAGKPLKLAFLKRTKVTDFSAVRKGATLYRDR